METESHEKMKVLLVDMSPISRKLIRKILSKNGYEVAEAARGEEAIQRLQAEYFHVVVTGLVLDDMSGSDLCSVIRALDLPRYTYIIALSSKSSIKDVTDAIESGADEFMNKPVITPLLLARLQLAQRIIDLEAKLKLVEMQSQDLLMKDALTEVYNRRRIQNDLPAEIKRASRYQKALSLVICDLDHFKSVNDTHGHLAGDKVLKEVAQRLKNNCRKDIDWVARYGGEEFVIVLPETQVEGALAFAENVRQVIESEPFAISSSQSIKVTMSFGAAGYREILDGNVSPEEILGQADLCLYKAKEQGRNQVCYSPCVQHGPN
ncbi:diguanylate cyclase [Pelagicoccus sp. SDUM812002]|uniref:GGDEF domain-containing response regulator n=1 Tax=Pelagicoccus sp. SDUM812002 TaxID=3041266 RepID=UPI00280CDF75|nr:diguanylate cyclase [Pelagicoccus sp. SDUM812002]MDQ8186469.1 diguanylate cyclase [Pelagicoccus sp. SDUM812002]